jgi:hypothetical protein
MKKSNPDNKAFIGNLLFGKKNAGETKSQKLVKELFTIPKKNKGIDVRHYIKPDKDGQQQQSDLLFLPNSAFGYKYVLVVIDIANNKADFEPLKEKTSQAVVNGFKKIYDTRNYIDVPQYMNVDSGSEFMGKTREFLQGRDIIVKVSAVQRHSQTAYAEYINKLIGKAIFALQTEKELSKGKTVKSWTEYIDDIRDVINEKAEENAIKNSIVNKTEDNKENKLFEKATPSAMIDDEIDKFVDKLKKHKPVNMLNDDVPLAGENSKNTNILEEGTKVRVALDYPISAGTGEKLHGKFRAGDIRWSKEIHTIDKVILTPNQPISYLVSDIHNAIYLRNQLQLVK